MLATATADIQTSHYTHPLFASPPLTPPNREHISRPRASATTEAEMCFAFRCVYQSILALLLLL